MIRYARSAALLVFLAVAAPIAAQDSDSVSVLDGVYNSEQAAQGKQVFEGTCQLCHTPGEFTGVPFQVSWAGRPLGALFSHIRMTMPLDSPGSLTPEEYTAVIAYMLELNGYPKGERPLPAHADSLSLIRMERRPTDGR